MKIENNKIVKRIVASVLIVTMSVMTFVGCKQGDNADAEITVVSREEGSGTRGAFTELVGVAEDVDNTTDKAEITNSTSVMLTTIAGNKNAIGYVSLGSLSDKVKAVKVDGKEATVENIKSGAYKVSRPFNIVTKDGLDELSQDFITFILSKEGQAIIEEEGYISLEQNESYKATKLEGTIAIAGSTSVGPVMEVLADAYKELNSNVKIEIQQSGSSAGITSTIEGVCSIGMASREIKDSEKESGVTSTVIAMDGIVVIINKKNDIDSLPSETIKDIYTGKITK